MTESISLHSRLELVIGKLMESSDSDTSTTESDESENEHSDEEKKKLLQMTIPQGAIAGKGTVIDVTKKRQNRA
ncbi:hypothetical protein Golomagni_04650 [Golovinomyces magnicellulatus]|nr:hypothetical protein Golomagni_04650 [Golovinomyces magnicellulatus]